MFREKRHYGQTPDNVVRSSSKTFRAPLKWEKEAVAKGVTFKVFVCSWSDFFHEGADAWRKEAWDIMRACPHLIFQLCTKRPERIAGHLPADWGTGWSNVWVGTTVEDATVKHRIQTIRAIPAAIRFLSVEPLLGPLGLHATELKGINWVITACESGANRTVGRPMDHTWAEDATRIARAAGAKTFLKQIALDGKLVADPTHPLWPAWGVREFPLWTNVPQG
jgi:protein gp37